MCQLCVMGSLLQTIYGNSEKNIFFILLLMDEPIQFFRYEFSDFGNWITKTGNEWMCESELDVETFRANFKNVTGLTDNDFNIKLNDWSTTQIQH